MMRAGNVSVWLMRVEVMMIIISIFSLHAFYLEIINIGLGFAQWKTVIFHCFDPSKFIYIQFLIVLLILRDFFANH